jgi:tetratricopeptide (TPR) repeat protein
MSIITKEWAKKFEEAEYLQEILNGLREIQEENGYTDEEMDNDLDVALWRAFVYNNMDSYEYYELSEKTLAKVKDKGVKSGVWCYRYSCALAYMRKFEEALEYSRLGTEVEPDYPWGWLQLGRLCYKFNLLDEAFRAIDKGLELVPNDYEFLTLKDDIENDRGYAYANSHYINEEVDKNSLEDRLIDIDDEELYNQFLNKSELEKKLDILHREDRNQEIIDIINSLPKEELTYDILGKLARAYNNNNEYDKGMEILLQLKDEGENTALWNFRIGYSCYYSGRLEEAQKYFERCLELNPEEPDADILLRYIYSDLGNRKIEEEKPEEALEYFKKARELAKDTEGIIFSESDLAWIYDHTGDYEKAFEFLKNVVSLGRDDIWVHSELGFCLGGLGKFEEAVEEFKKAIEQGRDDVWIFARLGGAYKELERYDEALETYFKGLEADSDDIYINSEIAWIYDVIKDDCNTGLKYLDKVKKLGRDDIWINSEYGWVYNHIGKYDEGLHHLEKAREMGRDDIWINFEIGYSLARLNREEEALNYYLKAKEMGRDDVGLNSELGYCLTRLGRYDEALSHYLKAKELGRDDEWLNIGIAECLGELGKEEEAIEKLKKTLTFKDCNEILITSQLGYLYGKINNSKEALKYLYRAEELGRNDIWLYSEIGWNLADDSNTYEEALKYFNKAVELGRDDIWIDGQLGFVLSKLGNYKEAISHFEKVRFASPEDNWIAYQLGSAYRKNGDIDKAIEILNSSIETTQFRGWVELELAVCYALVDDKEKAQKYLEEAELYIGGEKEESLDVKRDFEMVRQLLQSSSYLA